MPVGSCLSQSERRILQAFAETLMPQGGPFEVGAADIDSISFFEKYMALQEGLVRLGLKYVIRQWNWLPILYLKSRRRFTSMTPDQRVRFMEWLSEDRFFIRRINVFVIKFILAMALYGDARVETAIGYRRHCLGESSGDAAETSEEAAS